MPLSEEANRAIRDALWKSDFRLAEFEGRAEGRSVRFLASTLLQRQLADDAPPVANGVADPLPVPVPPEILEGPQFPDAAPDAAAGPLGRFFIPSRVVSAKAVAAGTNPLVSEVVNERVFLGRVSGIYVKLDTGTEVSGGIRISAFKGSGQPPLNFDDTQEDDLLPIASNAASTGPWGGLGHLGTGTSASTPGVHFNFNLLYEVVPPIRFVIRVEGATDRAAAIFEIGDLASGLTGNENIINQINQSVASEARVSSGILEERVFKPVIMFDPRQVQAPRAVFNLGVFSSLIARGFRIAGPVPFENIQRLT